MSIISFILIFGLLVLAHELGHFLLARRNGIHVTEFFIGMGPALFSFTRGETKYSLRLFPIGGACLFEGETGNIGGKDGDDDR
ncbi:MAG: site-2 protease family protein, partial [Lachnospiraceae bacterium]|nr:site-2 protease family protein [Lachnospiraceae bacterium]